mmetsp:Transcript_8256/g.32586  ORF Transcript_8256/g.32586 Transcript_8256/m.32586 type:complete len:288 (+) Transcript_8256:1888-2751(+)
MLASSDPSESDDSWTDDSTDSSSGGRHSAATLYASRTSASAAAQAGVGSCPGNCVHDSISSSFGLKSARLCKPVSVFSTTNMSDLSPLRDAATTASDTSRTHSAWRPSTATRHASAARLAILNEPVRSSTTEFGGTESINVDATSDSISADASRVRASIASHIRAFASLARSTASSASLAALNTEPMPVSATSRGSDRPSNRPLRRSHSSTAASRASRHRRSVSPTNVSASASSSSTDSRSAEADATARATLARGSFFSESATPFESPSLKSSSSSSTTSSADPRTG